MWHGTRFRKKRLVAARSSELKSRHAYDDKVSIQLFHVLAMQAFSHCKNSSKKVDA
jgi:hypothetical protein